MERWVVLFLDVPIPTHWVHEYIRLVISTKKRCSDAVARQSVILVGCSCWLARSQYMAHHTLVLLEDVGWAILNSRYGIGYKETWEWLVAVSGSCKTQLQNWGGINRLNTNRWSIQGLNPGWSTDSFLLTNPLADVADEYRNSSAGEEVRCK